MSTATRTLGDLTGRQVVDTSGEKIGTIQDVHYDEAANRPEWLVVKAGLFGTKRIFVPARDARVEDNRVMVPYTEDRVKDSPSVANENAPSSDEERELYLYYGLEFPEPASMPAMGADAATSVPSTAETPASQSPAGMNTGSLDEAEGRWGPGMAPNEQEDMIGRRRGR